MCGLFGIINSSAKTLDLRAFCTLGVMNDSRGGDSCGVSLDGKIEYGFGPESALFIDFISVSKLLFKKNRVKVALGHCRKASVGGVSLEKAQPVKVYGENGELDMIVIHNGTIYNYTELANKYLPGEDISKLSDSQVMAKIFHKGHYAALREYRGGGVFIIHDVKNDTVYLFKGASKANEHDKDLTEERPLFCCYEKDSFIFSSLAYPLVGLYPRNKVYQVPCNILYKVHKGKLVKLETVDRSQCLQSKPAPIVSTYNNYWNNYIMFDHQTGRYKLDNVYLSGKYFFSDFGYKFATESKWVQPYWFWDGYILPGPKSYEAVATYSRNCTDVKKIAQLAKALTYYPFNEDECWMESYADGAFHVVTDSKVTYPLSREKLIIKNGSVTSIKKLGITEPVIFNDLDDRTIQNIVNNVCNK